MLLLYWFAIAKHGATVAHDFFRSRGPVAHWAGVGWQVGIMPKHCFTFWLFAHGRLRTADRLPYEPYKRCSLCRLEEESNAHIYFCCTVTRQLNLRQSVGTAWHPTCDLFDGMFISGLSEVASHQRMANGSTLFSDFLYDFSLIVNSQSISFWGRWT